MPVTLYASFADPANAEKAVAALLEYGVFQEDLSVVANENYTWGSGLARAETPNGGRLGGETRGTAIGATGNAMSGSTIAPVDNGSVGVPGDAATACVPGVGNLLGSGLLSQDIELAEAISPQKPPPDDVAGVARYLKDEGIPMEVAEKFNDIVRSGGAILAVALPSNNVDGPTGQALIERYGAANTTCYWPHHPTYLAQV